MWIIMVRLERINYITNRVDCHVIHTIIYNTDNITHLVILFHIVDIYKDNLFLSLIESCERE